MVDVHDQLNATQRARVTGLCAIRDHARALLDAQLADEGDGRLGHLRAMLNGTYERFVSRYGCLSTRANALAFRRDPDYPLLLSLEHYDEEADTARKAALFTRRTLTRVVEPSTAGEPAEALARPSSGAAGSIRLTWRTAGAPKRRCWRHWPERARFSSTRPTGNGRPPTTTCRAT
jgi:hypothetical protein